MKPRNWFREIDSAILAWRAGTTSRVVVPSRQAENRFMGSLKGLQLRALISANKLFHLMSCRRPHCYENSKHVFPKSQQRDLASKYHIRIPKFFNFMWSVLPMRLKGCRWSVISLMPKLLCAVYLQLGHYPPAVLVRMPIKVNTLAFCLICTFQVL